MRILQYALVAALAAMSAPAMAQASCPNQSTTVTIPTPTGTAHLSLMDQTSCAPLDGTQFTVYNGPNCGALYPALGATSKPEVAQSVAGFDFTANGAPYGTTSKMCLLYKPNGVQSIVTYTVGAPITAIVAGTTTP